MFPELLEANIRAYKPPISNPTRLNGPSRRSFLKASIKYSLTIPIDKGDGALSEKLDAWSIPNTESVNFSEMVELFDPFLDDFTFESIGLLLNQNYGLFLFIICCIDIARRCMNISITGQMNFELIIILMGNHLSPRFSCESNAWSQRLN